MDVAKKAQTEDRAKSTVPQRKILRFPMRSAILPTGRRKTTEARRKISRTQPRVLALALNSRPMSGKDKVRELLVKGVRNDESMTIPNIL